MVKDILVKNNIIKADKAIIDIGIYSAKILEAHYTAKCVDIEDANIIKTGFKGEFDFEEFAKRVDAVLVGKVRKDIIVSLPSSMAESKIISIKNKTFSKSYFFKALAKSTNTSTLSASARTFKSTSYFISTDSIFFKSYPFKLLRNVFRLNLKLSFISFSKNLKSNKGNLSFFSEKEIITLSTFGSGTNCFLETINSFFTL